MDCLFKSPSAAPGVLATYVSSRCPLRPCGTQRSVETLTYLPTYLLLLRRVAAARRRIGASTAAAAAGTSTAAAIAPRPAPPLSLVVTSNTFAEAMLEDEVLTEPLGAGRDGAGPSGSAGGGGGGAWKQVCAVSANPFVSLELMQSGTLGTLLGAGNAGYRTLGVQPAAVCAVLRIFWGGACTSKTP